MTSYSWTVSSVQLLSCLTLVTLWTAARQASLSITNPWSLFKLMSIESVMPSNHLILCHPLLLLPSIFPSIGVFSNELVLHIRWPKYWSFSFSISPSNEYSGPTSQFWTRILIFNLGDIKFLLGRPFRSITVLSHHINCNPKDCMFISIRLTILLRSSMWNHEYRLWIYHKLVVFDEFQTHFEGIFLDLLEVLHNWVVWSRLLVGPKD